MPSEKEGITYSFIATNVEHADEKLIASKIEGKEFFLLLKENHGKTLLKSDKLTRPSANYYIQKALLTYARASGSTIIDSNVPDHAKNVHLSTDSALKNIHYFVDNFPTDRDVHIEIGFGSGRHLLHQAKANPDKLFIGLEIHKASIEQVLKQVNIHELDNVMLIDYDARLFMEFVPSNIVEKIYVHFPVPWDKKPHRRVISQSFVNEAIRVLKPGGKLELRTDSDNYFAYSFETFMSLSSVKLDVYKNQQIAVTSKYEDRWRRMEKNIYDIIMTAEEESPPLEITGKFDFEGMATNRTHLLTLNGKTERFEGGFIHFERLYETSEGALMYRLSMGSFDRPEHLYLLLEESRTHYYPQPPVRSRINLVAHDHLKRLLHG